MKNVSRWHVSINDAIKAPNEKDRISSLIIENQDMQIRYYSPKKKDTQVPHQQDEVYVIAKGSGTFVRNNVGISFHIGDIIFVPKNEHHYFKDYTDDFATWVIFYGSKN